MSVSPDIHPRARSEIEMHVLPDGSVLLFDPVASEGHVLTPVGGLTWDYCDGELSCDEIAGEIETLIPQAVDVRRSILEILNEFQARGLLQAAVEVSC